MKITVMAVTLVTLCILATNAHAAYGFCCRRYTPVKLRFSDIRGFSIQQCTELCPLRAIICHTKKGKICADPTQKWVIDYISIIETLAKKVSLGRMRPHRSATDYVKQREIAECKVQKAGQGPDRIATDNVKQREYITEKVHQEAEPQPDYSFASTSDKIIEDGPLPMKQCKW